MLTESALHVLARLLLTFSLAFFLRSRSPSSYVLARRTSSQARRGHLPQTIYWMNARQNAENTQKNTQNRGEHVHKHARGSPYKPQPARATTEDTGYENHPTRHYLTRTQT